MAKSQATAAFESLVNQKNKDMMLRHRGTKNQFQEFGGPDGKYYGRIHQMVLDTFEMETKKDGAKTGFKEKVPRVQVRGTTVCSDDNTIAPSELERWKGEPMNIGYLLISDDDWQRFYGDLETIGIDTKKMVLLEQDKSESDEYTLAEVAESISEEKPYCRFAVSTSKTNQRKYCNYRGSVVQADLEGLLGHSLDGDSVEAEYVQTESQEGLEVPFEGNKEAEPDDSGEESDPNLQWDEEKNMWHKLDDDTWYDAEGNPVEVEKPKPKRIPPSFAKKPEPKKEAPKGAVRKPGQILRK